MTSMVTETTVSVMASPSLSEILGFACVLILLILFLPRSVAEAVDRPFACALRRTLDIGIVPLLFAFLWIIVMRVAGVLG